MKALSIRQPWAWLILNAGKDIENRDWPTRFRGRILVHASKGMTGAEYESGIYTAMKANPGWPLPASASLERGGIVGSVEIVDCVTESDSPWFFGRYGFVLRDPQALPFTPCKGQLGFFDVNENNLNFGKAKEISLRPVKPQPMEHRDSADCWCGPTLDYVDPETGVSVYVHKRSN